MGKKRNNTESVKDSPTQEDFDRIAEDIEREYGKAIIDRDSFRMAFFDHMKEGDPDSNISEEQVYDSYVNKFNRGLIDAESEFKKAGGKNLKQDRKQTKNVVPTLQEYRRKGASRTDYRGIDTKEGSVRSFIVKNRGKSIRVYRDSKGRFTRGGN